MYATKIVLRRILLSWNYTNLHSNAKMAYFGLLTLWLGNEDNYNVKVNYRKLMKITRLSTTSLYRGLKELELKKFITNKNNKNRYELKYKLNKKYLE